jgi:ATP synthase protein I
LKDNYENIFKNLSFLTYIGIMMILPIIAAVYLGNILDDKLGTSHIFIFVFIILGVAAGFRNVYKIVMKDVSNSEKGNRRNKK